MAQIPIPGQMQMMPPQMGQSLPQSQIQRPCIYVGDLEESINEQMLFNFFSKFGQIYAIKVMRDKYNKKSRGFAFVQFWEPKDAENAIKSSNHEKILKKSIRVCWKKNIRDFSNEANVYVKNLDKAVTIKELDSLFSQYGTILSSKLSLDDNGMSLGYGYIQFANKEQAEKCIAEANNKLRIQNKVVEVLAFEQKKARPDKRTNLYIKNLPTNKTQEELDKDIHKVFGACGEITSVKLTKHEGTQSYYAFVCFKENTAADQAYQKFTTEANPFTPEKPDSKLYINWHEDRRSRLQNLKVLYQSTTNETNLFTKNLKIDVTVEQLTELFKKFGEITSCVIRQPQEKPQLQQQAGTEQKQQVEENKNNEDQKQKPEQIINPQQQQQGTDLPPAQAPKQFVKTQFGYINFKTKEQAREALGKFKTVEEIVNLYQDGKCFLNYHIKKDQFQQFKQTNNRNKAMTDPLSQLMGGEMSAQQQQMFQRMAQMCMIQVMQYQMMLAQMQQSFYGMGMPNQNVRQQMGYGNLPSNQFNRQNQNRGPHQRQQNRPFQQKRGGRQHQKGGYKQRGQIQYQQKKVQQPLGQQEGQASNQQAQIQQVPGQGFAFSQPGITIQTLQDNMQEFQKLSQERQRTLLGELIFPSVSKLSSSAEIAPKITGMLIDLEVFEVTDILEFLENEEKLKERIIEAEDLITKEDGTQLSVQQQ